MCLLHLNYVNSLLKPCTLQIIFNTYSKTPVDLNAMIWYSQEFIKTWEVLVSELCWGGARAAATSAQPNETEQNCISSSPLLVISVCHFPLLGLEVLVYS